MQALFSIGLAGLGSAQRRLDLASARIASAAAPQADASGFAQTPVGDLAVDLVQAKAAVYAFKANLQVLRVADQLVGTLLDTKA